MQRLGLVLICAAAVAVAGCGSDNGDEPEDTTTATTTAVADLAPQPEPEEPISEVLPEINEAFASGDCDAYIALAHWQTRDAGGRETPPTEEECSNAGPLLNDFEGVEFTESAEFGTGAIIEAPAPEDIKKSEDEVVTMNWILDDGQWRHLQTIFVGDPQIGTEPAGDPMPNAETFIDAFRDGDCQAMEPVLDENSSLVQSTNGDLRKACEVLLDGRVFAPALEGTPETELVDFGGTLDQTFVGVPLEEDYFTMYLVTPVAEPGEDQATEMLVSDIRSNTIDPEELLAEEEQEEPTAQPEDEG